MNRNTGSYIAFLNGNDRSAFQRSQLSTRSDPFRSKDTTSSTIANSVSQDASDSQISGLDVYDPSLEAEMNAIATTSLSGSETDYGFTTGPQT
ncbi:MAG: hypothetical protein WCJ45_03400 [bacterium]